MSIILLRNFIEITASFYVVRAVQFSRVFGFIKVLRTSLLELAVIDFLVHEVQSSKDGGKCFLFEDWLGL